MIIQSFHAVLQITNGIVEPNASQSHHGFFFVVTISDHNNRRVVAQDRPGPGGILALESDIDRTCQVSSFKVGRFTNINQLRTRVSQLDDFFKAECLQGCLHGAFKTWTLLTILDGVVNKVARSFRLLAGDEISKLFKRHRLQGVVEFLLFADCRHRFFAQRLATQRTCSMSRIDQR